MEIIVHGVDPRASQADKITPPEPLPFVSRQRLAKVRHRVEPPTNCPHCGGSVRLVNNQEVYGTPSGNWPYLYLCDDGLLDSCGAYVGLHYGTDLPFGPLATAGMRRQRALVKPLFRQVVKENFGGDVGAAYRWLASAMGVERTHCHFGMFTETQCQTAYKLLYERGMK